MKQKSHELWCQRVSIFGGPKIKHFLIDFPFRSSRLSSTQHHSGQRCHFHIHHHKVNVSCLFLPFDPFFDFICDKNCLTTPAVKLLSSSPYFNSNSETLNFVRFLCCSLLSSSKEPLAVVELKAHCSRCQLFEYPCLQEAVVDLNVKDRPSWSSLCCRLAGKYCVTAHARTQQSSASGQTT